MSAFRLKLVGTCIAIAAAALAAPFASAQTAGSTWALLIGGLGGEEAYTEQFATYLNETRSLLVERHDVPSSQVIVLAEERLQGRPFVDDLSTAENVRAALQRLARIVRPEDHLYVVLFGHGSYDGTNASLNIPRRDLTAADYAALIDGVQASRVVFVITSSASGPFAEVLAGPDRVIMTATASGTERDATIFPRYFVEALRSAEADLDRDGGVSARELFTYAASRTARSFEETGHLATEHAVIDDDGDGTGTRLEDLDDSSDGHLAATTYLKPPVAVSAANLPLVQERQEIEREIASVKQRKSSMDEDAYYDRLEQLFVRLARLNRRIDQ